jgi:hypothetical protein
MKQFVRTASTEPPTTYNWENFTRPTYASYISVTQLSSVYLEPFQYTPVRSLLDQENVNTSTKKLSESLTKFVDQYKMANLTMTSSSNITNKLNINDYLNCERNLTKLTVFYSNSDKLTCFEILTNSSLLRCIDDLLETKLVVKLSFFYHVQLQPLFIFKSKMVCSYKNGTWLKWSQAKLAAINNQTIMNKKATTTRPDHFSAETSSEEETTAYPKNSTLIKLKNVFQANRHHKTAQEEYTEGENYMDAFDPRESLTCTLVTKKASNRKKLIWKLYLILKNQTCIPLMNGPNQPIALPPPLKTINKFVEVKNNLKPLDSGIVKNFSRIKTLTDESRSIGDDEVIKSNLKPKN